MIFIPTRAADLAALDAFVARAGRHYAKTRNFDFGPEDRNNVSILCPCLRYRLVTEAEVLVAVRARHTPAASKKFICRCGSQRPPPTSSRQSSPDASRRR